MFVREVVRSRGRPSSRLVRSASAAASGRTPGLLALVRHGESEYNRQDRFTGLKDPNLTAAGIEESVNAGRVLRRHGFKCDVAFTSKLKRAQQSMSSS